MISGLETETLIHRESRHTAGGTVHGWARHLFLPDTRLFFDAGPVERTSACRLCLCRHSAISADWLGAFNHTLYQGGERDFLGVPFTKNEEGAQAY
jgi:hypothetical protein